MGFLKNTYQPIAHAAAPAVFVACIIHHIDANSGYVAALISAPCCTWWCQNTAPSGGADHEPKSLDQWPAMLSRVEVGPAAVTIIP